MFKIDNMLDYLINSEKLNKKWWIKNPHQGTPTKSNMSYAYYIEYIDSDVTPEYVEDAFNEAFGSTVVDHVDLSIIQEYKGSWNAFTIYFRDDCVDTLLAGNINFFKPDNLFDKYALYHAPQEYWNVYLIKV